MRIPRALTIVFGVLVLVGLLAAGYLLSRPRGPVLVEAGLSLGTITPNADGEADVTEISYRLRRQADVTMIFEAADGETHVFRQSQPRVRGEYGVLFGGVVDGFVLPGEEIDGTVERRLLPDGEYRWVIQATDALTGQVDERSGSLTIADGDPDLPDLLDFSIAPDIFTPNQDGIDDLVIINAYLAKAATLTVYLVDDEGVRYYIPESQEERLPGEPGRHTFSWDGGVDMGRNPPPDGTYSIIADAQDAVGQRVVHEGSVEVAFSGLPLAEIVGQPVGDTVDFSAETVLQGDVLSFSLTVENYGDSPIRTSGPEPGYQYEQDETFASTRFYEESGAWRVGIHCDTCQTDYPWRWALGARDELTAIETGGQTYYYLMPGQRAVVSGSIRLTEIVEARNPQQFWAGLIHEDVGIAEINQMVDPHWIEILPQPDAEASAPETP